MGMVGYAPRARPRGPAALDALAVALDAPVVALVVLAVALDAPAVVLVVLVVALVVPAVGGVRVAGVEIAAETAEMATDVAPPHRDSRVARAPLSRRSQRGRSPFRHKSW